MARGHSDHIDVIECLEPTRETERGDRGASGHSVPALLEGEGYPQAASAGGVTPITVDEGAGVVVDV